MDRINILGANIDRIEPEKIDGIIEHFIFSLKQHYIVTPNPEIILKMMHDEELYYILSQADLALPDGVGLKMAALCMGKNIKRQTGADFIHRLLAVAENRSVKTAIASWEGSISSRENIELSIRKYWPALDFRIFSIKRMNYGKELDHDFLAQIAKYGPALLVTNLGAPYQEKFIYHYQKKMPSVKLAIGIGGGLDFITGKIKRAPKPIRAIGLEWLFRLMKEPHRLKRIANAVIIFPWEVFKWRFVHPFLYRPNVACLLYKFDRGKYYILIVERTDEPGHWQLPQGGTDGFDLAAAGFHELSEELNTDDFDMRAVFPNLYKYSLASIPSTPSKFKMRGYKGQKQGLYIAEFNGRDEDIRVNFWEHRNWKWAMAEKLIDEVYPSRREAAEIFLEKFKSITTNSTIKNQYAK